MVVENCNCTYVYCAYNCYVSYSTFHGRRTQEAIGGQKRACSATWTAFVGELRFAIAAIAVPVSFGMLNVFRSMYFFSQHKDDGTSCLLIDPSQGTSPLQVCMNRWRLTHWEGTDAMGLETGFQSRAMHSEPEESPLLPRAGCFSENIAYLYIYISLLQTFKACLLGWARPRLRT